ncbi:MAG: 6-carboxytetrahydropterin synthase QueD [Candidatus Peregrinibacteria bacterium]|nr:6-carboxytetrahydropterin synthase QueD [Candidatus Peregrinibacteria bacterium]
MFVTKIFTFDAAHALTKYYGKCENLHGHTFSLHVTVEGPVDSNGMVIDFVVLKRMVKRLVLNKLDHQNLNDHFENPSSENLVMWAWDQLKDLSVHLQKELEDPNLGEDLKAYLKDIENLDRSSGGGVKLYELKLFEGSNSFVTYRGE